MIEIQFVLKQEREIIDAHQNVAEDAFESLNGMLMVVYSFMVRCSQLLPGSRAKMDETASLVVTVVKYYISVSDAIHYLDQIKLLLLLKVKRNSLCFVSVKGIH